MDGLASLAAAAALFDEHSVKERTSENPFDKSTKKQQNMKRNVRQLINEDHMFMLVIQYMTPALLFVFQTATNECRFSVEEAEETGGRSAGGGGTARSHPCLFQVQMPLFSSCMCYCTLVSLCCVVVLRLKLIVLLLCCTGHTPETEIGPSARTRRWCSPCCTA